MNLGDIYSQQVNGRRVPQQTITSGNFEGIQRRSDGKIEKLEADTLSKLSQAQQQLSPTPKIDDQKRVTPQDSLQPVSLEDAMKELLELENS
jgi:hypothetical protein